MKKTVHKSNSRGHANHGWLNTYNTFSFATYFDPDRMSFGMLRVLNDDTVAAGKGFGTHPHENMEIVTIPLEGELEHRDSMGNVSVIGRGEVQVMSAGTGITHSEFNKNRDRQVQFLQIWVFPDLRNVEPRYGQTRIDIVSMKNRFVPIVVPRGVEGAVWIHQDAWFHLGEIEKGNTVEYRLKNPAHGVYIFMIRGEVVVAGERLVARDGMRVEDTDSLIFKGGCPSEILLIEVPMS